MAAARAGVVAAASVAVTSARSMVVVATVAVAMVVVAAMEEVGAVYQVKDTVESQMVLDSVLCILQSPSILFGIPGLRNYNAVVSVCCCISDANGGH
jgi:hypothetical protein